MYIAWKSGTVISYNFMHLKFPKSSKRFSSSLTRDVVIAFRMTAVCFPSEKKSQMGGL